MKNILKILGVIFVFAAIFVACDEDETTYNTLSFPNDAFVSLTASSASLLEGSTSAMEVVVNYSTNAAAATAAVNVGFTITSSNAVEGTDYEIVGGKSEFTFAPGVFTDKLEIKPIDNLMEDGDKTLTLTLNSSSAALGFPGPAGNGTTIDLTITDDDCAFSLQELGDASWSGADSVPAGEAGPNESQISTSFDGTNLLIEGIGYGWLTDTAFWNEVVVTSHEVIAQVDLVTGAIVIDEQPLCTTTWLGNVQPDYRVSATGVYTSCSQTMVLNYILYQGGGVLRSYTETVKF